VRDFLTWAERGHCRAVNVPGVDRTAGEATDPEQRWVQLATGLGIVLAWPA
jgi:hypothetical protein